MVLKSEKSRREGGEIRYGGSRGRTLWYYRRIDSETKSKNGRGWVIGKSN